MPKYKRYGYVTTAISDSPAQPVVSAGTVAFHLNPKKASDNLDGILEELKKSDRFVQIVEDTTEKLHLGPGALIIRTVLIEYVDGLRTRYSIEQWGVEVGRS